MSSIEFSRPSEKGELAVLESQFRIGFDDLIPDRINDAGETEKAPGLDWTSDDGLEMAYVDQPAVTTVIDDEDVVRRTYSGRVLNYTKTDPVSDKVDQLIIEDKEGSLYVTEFRGMPSKDDLERAERDLGGDPSNLGVNPLAMYIVEECLVKDGVSADKDDLNYALEIIRKMKNSGLVMPIEEDEVTSHAA